ncbi:MAG: hypothetical protein QXZ19_01645 [Thermoplasmata archaeon]
MSAEGPKETFLSCFKCGRIVRSTDPECPRCGLKFGPGTLFECPFCCGLVWRDAKVCSTCGIDLAKISESVEKVSSGFNMDAFVDSIINTELEEIKSTVRRVSCPGCGLMIRGDETKCPRCDLPLEEAEVDCPVCGEKMPISSTSCPNCAAVFEPPREERPATQIPATPAVKVMSEEQPEVRKAPIGTSASKKGAARKKSAHAKSPSAAKKGKAKPRKSRKR